MDFNYKWEFKDYPQEKNGYKVFSCFACGGGSTMGYKLAGYDVLGFNEIDKRMADIYIQNHKPKLSYIEDIRTFKNRTDLPKELYDLDILDGSPPCSSFSMSGKREKHWGKEKKFREGQTEQVLDTLFFDFIEVVAKLKPKIVISENVKGILMGNAINYVNKIYKDFDAAGYNVKHFLLNASKMGVPQKRERVFFIAIRKDIKINSGEGYNLFNDIPALKLEFNEKPIIFKEFYQLGIDDRPSKKGKMFEYWKKRDYTDKSMSDTIFRTEGVKRCFGNKYLKDTETPNTLTSGSSVFYLFDEYRFPNKNEVSCIQSFPQDFNFLKKSYSYIMGMSVPPIMMAQIAKQIQIQWLDKIPKEDINENN